MQRLHWLPTYLQNNDSILLGEALNGSRVIKYSASSCYGMHDCSHQLRLPLPLSSEATCQVYEEESKRYSGCFFYPHRRLISLHPCVPLLCVYWCRLTYDICYLTFIFVALCVCRCRLTYDICYLTFIRCILCLQMPTDLRHLLPNFYSCCILFADADWPTTFVT